MPLQDFRLLAETVPQIVWIASPKGEITYLNQRWFVYTGLTPDSSYGKKWLSAIHEEDVQAPLKICSPACLAEILEPPSSSQLSHEALMRIRGADGMYRWFLSRGVAVRSSDGRLLKWIGSSTDIDEQKKAEAAMDEARKLAISASSSKSAFLANMSHEIRTPLSVILGFTELLKNPHLDETERRYYLETMERNGRALSLLINDILDLSKAEGDRLDFESDVLNLKTLLDDVMTSLSIKARHKGLELILLPAPDLPRHIRSDATRLRQILLNVVGNAIKFTDSGSVTIQAAAVERRKLQFSIRDSGCGLTAESIAQLFKPFSQGDASNVRRHGGSGLGLILSRKLCRSLGGDLILRRTAVGKGSEFLFSIDPGEPVEPLEVAGAASPMPATEPGSERLSELRILLAEDAPDIRFLLEVFLQGEGAIVQTAVNGEDAVQAAMKASYDVILMDIQMPILDGLEATRRLRAGGYQRAILALTANAMEDERKKCMEAGFDEHLPKPIQLEKLVTAILRHGT